MRIQVSRWRSCPQVTQTQRFVYGTQNRMPARGPFSQLTKRFALVLAVCLSATVLHSCAAPKRMGELSLRYHEKKDAVSKAKFFPRLGDAYIELLSKRTKEGEYDEAGGILDEYLHMVKALHTELRAAVADPEKKPGGFKQLEIHLRKTIRRLDDVIAALPYDQRETFEAGRRELDKVQAELVKDLFPRQPGRIKPQEK